MNVIVKMSGLNWLCIKLPDRTWLPMFKLTDEQAREYSECVDVLKQQNDILKRSEHGKVRKGADPE